MPNHKKPFDVLQMSGAMAKNPQRFRDRAPEPRPNAPLGKPPKHLTADEQAAWKEIAKSAVPGTLFNTDRITLEVATRLLVRFRAGQMVKASEISVLVSLLARFGMTPADRTKLTAEVPREKSPQEDEWSFVHRPSAPVRPKGGEWSDTSFQVDPACLSKIPN